MMICLMMGKFSSQTSSQPLVSGRCRGVGPRPRTRALVKLPIFVPCLRSSYEVGINSMDDKSSSLKRLH
ncbi:hypothetical protein L1987_79688 [Smallanthus sonchifolius]|uniref:Uncharacterized protein n=1 Tax=Smallanthus sonchifolius TaxID=185202 RepID=A0ACB8YM34_9ASTR|nr:hypothetical protein L1987_79688 [Smallanthus sonchifolius]